MPYVQNVVSQMAYQQYLALLWPQQLMLDMSMRSMIAKGLRLARIP